MIYGYVRISTKHQSIERQIRNIKNSYPQAFIVQEIYSGTKMDRPIFCRLTSKLKSGDVVVFDSVSRMSRNAEEGFKLYEDLYSKNIDLLFLKEPQINTTTYKKAKERAIPMTNTSVDYILSGVNRYLLELAREQILLAFDVAQKEVDDLHTRTKEGLLTAKLSGKTLGHRKNTPLVHKKTAEIKNTIIRLSKDFNGTLSDADVMKIAKCCRKTYYKYKAQLKRTT